MTIPARKNTQQVVHAIRGKVALGDVGIGTGIQIGTIPAGSFVLPATVHVKTAFDAGTTNVLVVGSSADDDGFVASAGAAAGTAGVKGALTGAQSGAVLTADTPVYIKYTQTGTAATAGAAEVVLPYYPHAT